MKKILILILIILIFSNYITHESLAKISVKKIDEIRCTYMYEKFKIMGEKKMLERYPHYRIMDICLKLFHDQNWNFIGKDLIDQKYLSNSTSILKFAISK
ncbi:MAG: hypothetical protein K8Q89_00940 [Nitrosarchaeum sp.]|nr:hypothetical protein [Nitrosarchaeum sp.]